MPSLKIKNKKYIPRVPNPNRIITSASNKSSYLPLPGCGTDNASWSGCWSPTDGVDTHTMRMEDLMRPAVITELKNAYIAVGRSTSKKTSGFMWRPRHHIHGGGVEREIENSTPCAVGGWRSCAGRLFAPDQDLTIV